jgi:hypothetical protein
MLEDEVLSKMTARNAKAVISDYINQTVRIQPGESWKDRIHELLSEIVRLDKQEKLRYFSAFLKSTAQQEEAARDKIAESVAEVLVDVSAPLAAVDIQYIVDSATLKDKAEKLFLDSLITKLPRQTFDDILPRLNPVTQNKLSQITSLVPPEPRYMLVDTGCHVESIVNIDTCQRLNHGAAHTNV